MGKVIGKLARLSAYVGGVVLTLLVLLTTLSVLGRGGNTLGHSDFLTGLAPGLADWLIATGVGPIQGDFEVVEAGIAFAIFAFLPVTQFYSGHASVDIFTSFLSERINRFIRAFWEVILTGIILLITWRLFEGMQDKIRYGETTFLLQFPIWWAYAASFASAIVSSIVAIYCAYVRVLSSLTGREYLPNSQEAVH